jgi:hypothetical protein
LTLLKKIYLASGIKSVDILVRENVSVYGAKALTHSLKRYNLSVVQKPVDILYQLHTS